MIGRLALVSLVLLAFRVVSAAMVVVQPGFTDAYYYVDVARRLAHGEGLTADFVWNFLEAPRLEPLPVASHRFWMPLASLTQAAGILLLEPLLGVFRAAQAATIAIAAFVPVIAYAAGRSVGATPRASLAAAALAGIGAGAFAPAWVTLDSFAVAAVIGTCFFLAFGPAARGSVRVGALAGALVGLLFLARAEGAFFGLALLFLAGRPVSRVAGIFGTAIAIAIGLAWLARGYALGGTPDLLGRTVFLARYEDFFALTPTGTVDLGGIVGTRLGALWSDLLVAVFALLLALAFPLAVGIRAAWRLPAVRAFAGLALLLYVFEGLVWPLHATRGSYFHSLAAFYPFGMGLVALGGETWLAGRETAMRRLAVAGTLAGASALALFGLAQWDAAFNAGYRARLGALEAIPAGPFLAIDAAAWRWIADRPVFVTPADGPGVAACIARRYGAQSIVLEAAHFSRYEPLYSGTAEPSYGTPVERGAIRIFTVPTSIVCPFDHQ